MVSLSSSTFYRAHKLCLQTFISAEVSLKHRRQDPSKWKAIFSSQSWRSPFSKDPQVYNILLVLAKQ